MRLMFTNSGAKEVVAGSIMLPMISPSTSLWPLGLSWARP